MNFKSLNITAAAVNHMNKIIRSLDAKKATGSNRIPLKVVEMSVNIIKKITRKPIRIITSYCRNYSDWFSCYFIYDCQVHLDNQQTSKEYNQ